jgi:hypothetical protein
VTVIGVQGFDFIQQALLHLGHFGRLDAVFACHGIDRIKAFFEVLKTRWIGIEVIKEAVQFSHGFFDLDLCAGQQAAGFAQGANRIVDARKAIEAGGKGVQHIPGITFAALFDHLPANAQQGFGVGQVLVFLFQLLQLIFAEAKVFQFFELIAEQLMAGALLIAGIGKTFQFLAGLAPALGGQVYLTGKVRRTRVFIE